MLFRSEYHKDKDQESFQTWDSNLMRDNRLDAGIRIITKAEISFEAAVEALDLHEIGRLELPPSAVAHGEHPHCLPTFIEFIDDTIDIRLLAVEQVPQLSL